MTVSQHSNEQQRGTRSRTIHFGHILLACVLVAIQGHARPTWAHEGHAALPSTGASVHEDQLLLSKAAIKAVGMEIHRVKIGNISEKLRVNARVELSPLARAKVAILLSGRVKKVHVKPGSTVKKGADLATIESLELESLQVNLLNTKEELSLLEARAKLQNDLFQKGGIAGSEYRATLAKSQKKRAEFEIIKRKLVGWGLTSKQIQSVLKTEITVSVITVKSPMNGVVEHVTAQTGQLVQSTDHLFDIVDLSTVYLVGEILEADARLVKNGQSTSVTFAGLPGKSFSGRIHHQHLHLHLPERSIHVVVKISNTDENLRPGMFGRMTITIAEAKKQMICPSSALIENGKRTFVLSRVDKGKFQLQPVKVGMRTRTQVVIKYERGGLFVGQQVISRGTYLLASMFDGHKLMKNPQTVTDAKKKTPQTSSSSTPPRKRLSAARAVVEIPIENRAFATSLIEGWVVEIPKGLNGQLHEGAFVKEGQVLARIRSQKLRNMQLELLQANASFNWTQDEVKRLEKIAKTGGEAKRELRQRTSDLKRFNTQKESLIRQLELIGLSARHLKALLKFDLTKPTASTKFDPIIDVIEIRSPISGHISQFSVSPGELVHSHDKLFEIQDTSDVWIKAYYFERDAAQVEVGQDAVLTFPANPSLRLQGKVKRIAPQLASKDRVLPVWIEVTNPGGFLKEGMLADVDVKVSMTPSTLAARKARK